MQYKQRIEARGATFHLEGHCDAEFQAVAEAFAENFRIENELGAAVSIMREGRR